MHNMEAFYFETAASLEGKTSIWEKDVGRTIPLKKPTNKMIIKKKNWQEGEILLSLYHLHTHAHVYINKDTKNN